MTLRPQCHACPWHNLADVENTIPGTVAHAAAHPDGFTCHTRLGHCDGPRHALHLGDAMTTTTTTTEGPTP